MGESQVKKIDVLSAGKLSASEGLDSIFNALSVRAKRVLVNLGVKDEASLLQLTRDDLRMVWSCGKKTIAEVEALKAHKDRVYSISLWRLRFGNITQMLDTALRQMGKPSHYTEVAKNMHIWRTGFSERNAHAALDRSENALLWDRGTFVHKDNVVLPFSIKTFPRLCFSD